MISKNEFERDLDELLYKVLRFHEKCYELSYQDRGFFSGNGATASDASCRETKRRMEIQEELHRDLAEIACKFFEFAKKWCELSSQDKEYFSQNYIGVLSSALYSAKMRVELQRRRDGMTSWLTFRC